MSRYFQTCALNGNIHPANATIPGEGTDLYSLTWFAPTNNGMLISLLFMFVFHFFAVRTYIARFISNDGPSFLSFASVSRLIPLLWASTILISDLALIVNNGYANCFAFQPLTWHFLAEYTLSLFFLLQGIHAFDIHSKDKITYSNLTMRLSTLEEGYF